MAIPNEDGKTVSDEKKLCRTFRTYLPNIIADLLIPNAHEDVSNIRSNQGSVLVTINNFSNSTECYKD